MTVDSFATGLIKIWWETKGRRKTARKHVCFFAREFTPANKRHESDTVSCHLALINEGCRLHDTAT